MSLPRCIRLAFCRPCNARERAIIHGRCHVCGQDPNPEPGADR